MTINEMVEVLKAYEAGKQIEVRAKDDDSAEWISISGPAWNFFEADYRVKPEPKYVPYDSVLEVNRDKWVKEKGKSILSRINEFDLEDAISVRLGYDWISLQDLFDDYTYEDGTPCGKKVE